MKDLKKINADLTEKILTFCETACGRQVRGYQRPLAKGIITMLLQEEGDELTALCSRQSGKCLAKGTPVLMFDGSTKNVEDIIVGDLIMGPDSTPRKILSLARGQEEMFEVKSLCGSYTVNKSHILSLKDEDDNTVNIPLTEYKGGMKGWRMEGSSLPSRYEIEIISKGIGDYYGFTIDGDHLFVLGDYTVTHNTEMIAMVCAGCMIILPKLSEMFPDHVGLQRYKQGLWIGIFAPSGDQSDTTYSRMKGFIQSQHAKMILSDDDLALDVTTKGRVIALTNGSICRPTSAAKTANIESKTYQLVILEEAQDLDLRVVRKSIGPMLADKDGCFIKVGTANTKKSDFSEAIRRNKRRGFNHYGWTWREVAKENKHYGNFIKKEKDRIGEDSDEFKMSYECIFIHERGMFMTEEQFDSLAENSPKNRGFIETCSRPCCAGIDFGKSGDPTIITIGIPDYDHPVIQEDGEERYRVQLINWLELEGDYEKQWWRMIEFIDRYNVVSIVCDSTGSGDPIVDRLNAYYMDRCDVLGITFTNSNKDLIYRNLQKEILTERIYLPTTSGAVRSMMYRKFRIQMCDLEKEWKGRFMVCHHPDAKDAHDDYPDSMALMMYGVYQNIMQEMEEDDNWLFKRRRSA